MKCVALFIAPAIVAIFVKNEHSFDDWKWVFILNGGLLLFVSYMEASSRLISSDEHPFFYRCY